MAVIKSSNIIGNPNHESSNGQFTSADSTKGDNPEQERAVISEQSSVEQPSKPLKMSLKGGLDLNKVREDLKEAQGIASIPFLNSATDICNYADKFITRKIAVKINEMFGKYNPNTPWLASCPYNEYFTNNLFVSIIGKYRWPDNSAHIVSPEEFENIKNSGRNIEKIWRGVYSSSYENKIRMLNGYGDYHNEYFVYGNGMYGTSVYTTVSRRYALDYGVTSETQHLMECLLDNKGAHTVDDDFLLKISYYFKGNKDAQTLVADKVSKKLQTYGIEGTRADAIGKGFVGSIINDTGLVGVLVGADYQVNDHQRNLFNLKRFYIKKDW